jgi:hypothetical protein
MHIFISLSQASIALTFLLKANAAITSSQEQISKFGIVTGFEVLK